MIYYCCRCKCTIKIPNFSEEQKNKIWAVRDKLIAIKIIQQYSELSIGEAKALKIHLNQHYGKCLRCKKDDLVGENVTCPKCKGFSVNWNFAEDIENKGI